MKLKNNSPFIIVDSLRERLIEDNRWLPRWGTNPELRLFRKRLGWDKDKLLSWWQKIGLSSRSAGKCERMNNFSKRLTHFLTG